MAKNVKSKRTEVKVPPNAPQIIVKFREGGSLWESRGRLKSNNISLDHFENAVRGVKGATVKMSSRMEKTKIRDLQARARRTLKKEIPSLDLFVRITVPDKSDVEALLKEIRLDPQVEYACIAGIQAPPPTCIFEPERKNCATDWYADGPTPHDTAPAPVSHWGN